MRYSVLIPTIGRSSALADALHSVALCDPRPHEVVVIDGSDDRGAAPLVDAFAEANPGMGARHLPSPRGASVQRNRGIAAASGDVVVFVDDDAVLDPGLFAALDRAYADPGLVGATGRVVQERYRTFGNQQSGVRRLLARGGPEGSMTSFGYPRHLQRLDVEQDVEFMQGCLMTVRRDTAAEVRFDERMGGSRRIALLEDEDFSFRVSRRGTVRHLPDAVVHHRALGFHSRRAREYSRLIVVDRAYLLRKNFAPTPRAIAQFAALVAVFFAHRIVNREWAGVVGLAEGVRDALREARHGPLGWREATG